VEEEGLAADLVEDLGAAGLEARALARGHDCDSEVGGLHTEIMVSCARVGSLGVHGGSSKRALTWLLHPLGYVLRSIVNRLRKGTILSANNSASRVVAG
jgi:hypothetical protein